MIRIVIIGAGGHAQVVADILWRMQEAGDETTPIGYLDDNPALTGERFLDLPVLGALSDLAAVPHDAVIVGIGDNATRRRVFESLRDRGERLVTACHPSAVIAPDVQIGCGCTICAGAVVNTGSRIGANLILNTGCTVDHHNSVGDHVHVAPGAHTGGEVTVGEGAFLGVGALVIPGRVIGDWAFVGAGAVVTKDVPARATAVGNPARVVRRKSGGEDGDI
jgi:sugar O-acyltransferase (sialic acid O-acetyltransferase NeuD family)